MFAPIESREWLRGRPQAALHDLGSLALHDDAAGRTPAVPPALANRSDPPAGVTLHTLLATAYGVDPEQVLVTAGADHAYFLAVAAALDAERERQEGASEGESVGGGAPAPRALVELPAAEHRVQVPAGLGAPVDRFRRVDDSWALDPNRVRDAAGPATALVAVTNRHDPSGQVADRETLAAAADAAAESGARLVVDESTAPYGAPAPDGPFGGPSAAGLDAAAVVGSLSFLPGLDALSVGWLIADPDFVARARAVGEYVPGVADATVALARRALYAREDLLAAAHKRTAANADPLAAFLAEHDALTGPVPEGAPYGFVSVADADGDAVTGAAWEAGVLVVPGRFFGDRERVRVSLGGPPDSATAGLRALAGALPQASSDD